jgi:hypothetical protein
MAQASKHLGIADGPGFAAFEAAMTLVDHGGVVVGISPVVTGDQIVKQQHDVIVELTLIGLQGQQIVGVLLDNRARNRRLAADGVNRDQTAPQIERLQQFRDRCDLVGFGGDLALAQYQPIRGGPGAHHVDRRLAAAPIMRTPQLLAVEGDHLATNQRTDGPHPVEEAGLELLRIEHPKDPPKGIMGRDPIREVEKGREPRLLTPAKLGDGFPIIGACDNGTDSEHQDIRQRMRFRAVETGVLQRSKVGVDTGSRSQPAPRLPRQDRM